MNVLIVNQQENIISPLNIEIIKTLRGTFSVDEIIGTFTNFFFSRMIVDITAIQNNEDVATYQKLSIGLPIEKIILLIPPNSIVANNYFLSKLISMGYYNFTTNGDGIMYLLNTPNTYKEVAYLHQANMAPEPEINSNSIPQNNYGPMQSVPNIPMNSNFNVKSLGVINVTNNAGASSLIYMMKKELEETFNMSVLAIEVDKRDFSFFRDNNMISVQKSSLAREIMQAVGYGCVLVDLNDYEDPVCSDTLYLIEPSIIKLNKLMMRDRTIFSKLKGKKVIINRSTLSEADIREFALEAGIDIYYVIPPLNDRERSRIIADFLRHLGIVK